MTWGKIRTKLGRKGASLVEYCSLIALISVLVIFAVLMLGRTVQDNFYTVASALSGASEEARGYTDGSADEVGTGEPRFEASSDDCIAEIGDWMPVWCFSDGLDAMPEGVEARENNDEYGEGGYWGKACAWDTIAARWIETQDPFTNSIYLSCDMDGSVTGIGGGGGGGGTGVTSYSVVNNCVTTYDGTTDVWCPHDDPFGAPDGLYLDFIDSKQCAWDDAGGGYISGSPGVINATPADSSTLACWDFMNG